MTTPVEYVVIPPSVKKIGSKAFGDCRKLVSVRIYDSTETIDADAFDDSAIVHTDTLTIYCSENSAAYNLAVEKGIHYVLVSGD